MFYIINYIIKIVSFAMVGLTNITVYVVLITQILELKQSYHK